MDYGLVGFAAYLICAYVALRWVVGKILEGTRFQAPKFPKKKGAPPCPHS